MVGSLENDSQQMTRLWNKTRYGGYIRYPIYDHVTIARYIYIYGLYMYKRLDRILHRTKHVSSATIDKLDRRLGERL